VAVLLILLVGLLGANLWALLSVQRLVAAIPTQPASRPTADAVPGAPAPAPVAASDESRDRFAAALKALLDQKGGREWQAEQAALLARYERLARTHKDLRLRDDDVQGKLAVAAVSVLAERSADHIEETVRKALTDNGFNARVIKLACDLVHEQFSAEVKDRP
jgi:hypothetical protein